MSYDEAIDYIESLAGFGIRPGLQRITRLLEILGNPQNKLKNFLAPNMQIYLKLSLIPLLIISVILLFNHKIHYHFKFTDIILFLPIIMIFFVGDARMAPSFAKNTFHYTKITFSFIFRFNKKRFSYFYREKNGRNNCIIFSILYLIYRYIVFS